MNNEYFIFTDESCITNPDKQYSSVCALSGSKDFFNSHEHQISEILGQNREYKFKNLNRDMKKDVLKLCDDVLFPAINSNQIRIDTLIWDNHRYPKNQAIMHYHLLLNILRNHPRNINWLYYPDYDRGKDYAEITDIVNNAANSKNTYVQSLIKLATEYNIRYGGELDSKNSRLIQITDIFAGLAAFSYNYYSDYTDWEKNALGALSFDFAQPDIEANKIAAKHNHKFQLLNEINERCKKYNRDKHSLNSKHGLCSFGHGYGMNFWLWGNDRSILKRAQQ